MAQNMEQLHDDALNEVVGGKQVEGVGSRTITTYSCPRCGYSTGFWAGEYWHCNRCYYETMKPNVHERTIG